jgi:chromosome segregation ATPase
LKRHMVLVHGIRENDALGGSRSGSRPLANGRVTVTTAYAAGKKRRRGEDSAKESESTRELVEIWRERYVEELQKREEAEEKLKEAEKTLKEAEEKLEEAEEKLREAEDEKRLRRRPAKEGYDIGDFEGDF